MKIEDVEKIIKMFEASGVGHIELEIDNLKIKLDKESLKTEYIGIPSVAQATAGNAVANDTAETKAAATPEVQGEVVTAPLVGAFHASPFPNAEPFVKVGSKVKKGAKLCIIEAMKVMNEITAPCDGVIKEIFVKENDMVDYGKKLFVIGNE